MMIGRVSTEHERTHLAIEPDRAKCGSKLDPSLASDGHPDCTTCQRYAGIEPKFVCDHCDLVVESPLGSTGIEIWHKCKVAPSKGGRRKMKLAK